MEDNLLTFFCQQQLRCPIRTITMLCVFRRAPGWRKTSRRSRNGLIRYSWPSFPRVIKEAWMEKSRKRLTFRLLKWKWKEAGGKRSHQSWRPCRYPIPVPSWCPSRSLMHMCQCAAAGKDVTWGNGAALQRRCAAYQLIPGVGQLVRWKNGKCSREMQNKVKGGRVTDAPGLPPPPYQPGCLTSSLLSGLSGLIAATRRNKARDSGNLNWRQRRHSSDRVWAVVTPASLPLFLQLWPPTWTWRCSLCFSHTHSECLISRGKNTNMLLDRALRRSTSHD